MSIEMKMLAVIAVCLLPLLVPCRAYSGGAGDDACGTMRPGHGGTSPSDIASPFEIIVSQASYNPGDTLQVTVQQKPGRTEQFKGFLLQARRAGFTSNQNEPIGTFTVGTNTKVKCSGSLGNAITHNSPVEKTSLTVDWTAPSDHEGHLEFRATFVAEFETYWLEEKSVLVTDPNPPDLPTPAPLPKSDSKLSKDSNKMSDKEDSGDEEEEGLLRVVRQAGAAGSAPGIDLTKCGDTIGCYRSPTGCSPVSECEMLVTWKDMNTHIHFEMSARTLGWMAVGFSKDKYMGDDSVIECVFNKNKPVILVQHSYNKGKTNIHIGTTGITHPDGERNLDGATKRLRCTFDRKKTSNHKDVFDLNNHYYMLMTMGDATPDGRKLPHLMDQNKEPKVSPYMVDLTKAYDVSGAARYPLVKAHGCLMVIAWVMSAGLAIIMARYYKPMWPNNRMCGERVWFAVHRFCMILTLFCTVAGFIIIFVQVGGYSHMSTLPNKAHPILGIIVTVLVIVNPLLALCRCHPKHKYRPVFNWIHWFIGTIAFVLQSPTVFIGLGLPKAFVPGWLTWVMVAFLLFHIVVELMLEIHGCINSKKQKERNQEWEMRKKNDPTHETSEKEPEPVGTRFKTIMISLYIIVMLVLGLIIVITIAAS